MKIFPSQNLISKEVWMTTPMQRTCIHSPHCFRLLRSTERRFSYFSAHPELEKPPFPYQIGKVFSVQAYTPAAPPDYRYTCASQELKDQMKTKLPLSVCLDNPPVFGTSGDKRVRLKIVGHVRGNYASNTQILNVEVLNENGSKVEIPNTASLGGIVAKLYDPLYYDVEEASGHPFANCDAAFSHETLAYQHLQAMQGKEIPRFYGSYSLDVPLSNDSLHSRPVRAILYKHVPGLSLDKIEAHEFTQHHRKEIMRAIIDADSKMYQLNVNNTDLHPRNVIVPHDLNRGRMSVRIIDFDHCICGSRVERGSLHEPTLEPRSGIYVYERWEDEDFGDSKYYFEWFVDWAWNAWLKEEYGVGD